MCECVRFLICIQKGGRENEKQRQKNLLIAAHGQCGFDVYIYFSGDFVYCYRSILSDLCRRVHLIWLNMCVRVYIIFVDIVAVVIAIVG